MSSYGYVRVAACRPIVAVGEPMTNAIRTLELVHQAAQKGVQAAVFPELGLTGYTCRDLFLQTHLQKKAIEALAGFVMGTVGQKLIAIVGAPLVVDDQLFNCAVAVSGGRILAVVPKTYLPGYKEFEEYRWFAPASRLRSREVNLLGQVVPIGTDILIVASGSPGFKLGIEICEDLWMPIPPSSHHALHGATILANLSASNEVVGKVEYRRDLVRSQSSRCVAGYIYSSCGEGESTGDVVFSGHCLIAENGRIVAESERFSREPGLIVTDLDVEALTRERTMTGSFGQAVGGDIGVYREVVCEVSELDVAREFLRSVNPNPFIPTDSGKRAEVCEEVFAIQTAGLRHRLEFVAGRTGKTQMEVAIGVSGGLDSTLALLATVRTFDQLGWDRKLIQAVTMPGFGTSRRTKSNAKKLCEALGVSFRTISISAITRQHLRAIGHEPCEDCLQCENAQARERTQILMDIGFVIGTGDVSEAAVGFCTFNGDQMSMYNVNSSVPKTLIRYIVEWVADQEGSKVQTILRSIVATPISPELRKLGSGGEITQKSEAILGPYSVIDFNLFQQVRHGVAPRKLLFLARQAWGSSYDPSQLRKWLAGYYQRFFAAQFKRDANPNGPKVGSVSLSQRGDWRMPSDASSDSWVSELDKE